MKRFSGLALVGLIILNIVLVACGGTDSSVEKVAALPASAPLSSGVSADDWPMLGRDARHSGYNPFSPELKSAIAPNLALRWVFEAGGPIETSPIVVGDNLYLNNGRGQLLALNRKDGTIRWRYVYSGNSRSSPAFAGGKVFIVNDAGNIAALNVADGKPLWQNSLNHLVWASPLIEDKTLYLATLAGANQPGLLMALDTESGAVLWQYSLAQGSLLTTPAVAGGAFYLPETASPALGGVVRVGKDSQPSSLNFEATLINRPTIYSASARQLYTATGRGLVALPAEQRMATPAWYFAASLDAAKTEAPSSPAQAGDLVLVPLNGPNGQGVLKAISAKDAAPRWEYKTEGLLGGVTAGSGGLAFVGTNDGRLVALEVNYGRELWAYQTGGPIRNAPVIAGDAVYLGGEDGRLYAFGPGEVAPPPPAGLQVYSTLDQNGFTRLYSLDAAGQSTPLTQADFAQPLVEDPQWRTFPARTKAGFALSPDGRKIAFASYSVAARSFKTNLFIMNADGSNPQPVGDANAWPQELAWSPDGKELFFSSARTNRLFSVRLDGPNQAEAHSPVLDFGLPELLQVSGDGRFIYFTAYQAGRERQAAVLGRQERGGTNPVLLVREDQPLTSLALSPDNRWLAYVRHFENQPDQIWLRTTQGEKPRKLAEGSGPIAFSPDGRWLSYTPPAPAKGRKLLALDANANLRSATSEAYPLALAVSGLAWAKPGMETNQIATIPEVGPVLPGLSDPRPLASNPTGKFVFSSNGRLYLMDRTATSFALVPGQPPGRNSAPQFSADGKRLVFVNEAAGPETAQVWLWDLDQTAPRQLTFKGRNWWPALSFDGKSVAFSTQRDNLIAPEIFLLSLDNNALNPQKADATAVQLTALGTGSFQPTWFTDNILLFITSSRTSPAWANGETVPDLWRLTTTTQAETYSLTDLDKLSDQQYQALLYPLPTPYKDGVFMSRLLANTSDSQHQVQLYPAFFNFNTAKLEPRRSECAGYVPVWLDAVGSSLACIADARLASFGPELKAKLVEDLLQGRTPAGGIWLGAGLKAENQAVSPPFSLLSSARYPVDGLAWGK